MKHLYAVLCCLCLAVSGQAQRPIVSTAAAPGGGTPPVAAVVEESPWSRVVDSLLLPLNKSQIPTGLLYDRVVPLSGLLGFNQVQADTSSAAHLRQAHLELYMSAYTRTGFRVTPARLRERAETLVRHDSVPLAVLDYRFHLLDTLAVQDNLIQFQNGRYYDVAGRSRSPYWQRDAVVAAPLADAVDATVRFYFGPQFVLSNRGRGVSHLVVDFNDGAPPATCLPGHLRTVHYATPGLKVLHLTVWFTDGTQLQTRAALTVREAASVAYRSAPVQLPNVKAAVPFVGYDFTPGLFGEGEALAVLHNQTSLSELDNGQNFKLRKPVIFLDGFDPGDKGKLLKDIESDKSLLTQLREAGIITALETLQRDLVILNFPKSPRQYNNSSGNYTPYDVDGGTDYIERNAFVLIELLNQLKSRLLPGEQYTIIGPSMGGLISRYALAYMEKMHQQDPTNSYWVHNTSVWLSFDSPHQGANIPLADQHYLDYYKNIAESAKSNLETKIQSPAARQMLLAYYNSYGPGRTPGGSTGFRDRFMQELRNNGEAGSLGYPVHVRRIALVNGRLDGALSPDGSPCGVAFNMNAKLRFWPAVAASLLRSFFVKLYPGTTSNTVTESTARFTASPNTSCTVFEGVLNKNSGVGVGNPNFNNIRTLVVANSTVAGSYDLAPGGWYDTQKQLKDQSEGGAAGESYAINVTNVRPNHTFIPTVSALGFQYQSMSNYQNTGSLPNPYTNLLGRDLVCTGEIPFDDYYGPASENTKHIQGLNSGMQQFLLRELAQTTSTPIFTSAPSSICPGTIVQFSVRPECSRRDVNGNELFPVIYTWSSSDPAITITSGQGTATVTILTPAGYNGGVDITVTAQRQGYAASEPAAHFVYIGPGFLSVAAQQAPCEFEELTVDAISQNINPASLKWFIKRASSSTYTSYATGQTSITLSQTMMRRGTVGVRCEGLDICTNLPIQDTQLFTVAPCGNRTATAPQQALFPNPADGYVDVTLPAELLEDPSSTAPTTTTPVSYSVTIYDGRGKPVLAREGMVGTPRLDVRALPTGLYHVQLRQGAQVYRRQLSIQH